LFCRPDALYAQIRQNAVSPAWLALEHGELERRLTDAARHVFLELLQSHLILRGQAVALAPVVGADGVERTHIRPGKTRKLRTTFGPVQVPRAAYSGRGL